MDADPALVRAREARGQLLARLDEEGETDLADKLRSCDEILTLVCLSCGHAHPVEKRCRKKWCPVCVRAIATKRSLKFAKAARLMKWPLHLTLTVENVRHDDLFSRPDSSFIRRLRRAFGKLRHRRLWKDNVAGGVAGFEVTNKGNGWHPHLHALVDCRWLAIKTPRPQAGESRESVRRKCRQAKHEFTKLWRSIIKEKHGVCWIRRVDDAEAAAQEVLKYAIKGSDLCASVDPIGPIIRQLDGCRLTTSFGSMFGARLVPNDEAKTMSICPACKSPADWMPQEIAEAFLRNPNMSRIGDRSRRKKKAKTQ